MMAEPILVRAVFKFKGTNNDEVLWILNLKDVFRVNLSLIHLQLKFKKGDLITITQKEDGGWWEGTLDGKTGWFPSNYVEEVAKEVSKAKEAITEEVMAKNVDYRQQVISDMLEKEQEFVSELRVLHNQYLQPLHHADM